jgi:hypothetical protein
VSQRNPINRTSVQGAGALRVDNEQLGTYNLTDRTCMAASFTSDRCERRAHD